MALAAVLAAGTVGCGDDGPPAGPTAQVTTTRPPRTTTSEAPTTSTPTPEQQVEAAYLAAMKTYYSAAEKPTPAAALEGGFTGDALIVAEENLRALAAQGARAQYDEGSPGIDVEAVRFETGDRAVVRVCIIDDGEQIQVSDGTILDDASSSQVSEATLVRVSGRWLVLDQRPVEEWPDAQGCPR